MPYSGGFVPLITIDSSQPKVLDWDNAEEVKFEDIIEDIRYIPLRDEEGIMGEQINQLLYCNGIFYLLDFQQDEVFLYDEEGKCVKKISDRGKGPKEYIAIGNIDINPETSELYVQDRILSSVLVYDLNGNFKYKFKLPVQNAVVYSIGDSTRLVQMQAFQNKGSEEMEGYSYLVMKGDSAYRKGFKYLPSQIGFCGADGVNDSYDNQSLYYQPLFSDSIYHVLSDSVCSLAYYFKDKESVWKKHWESDKFVNMINAQGTAIMDIYDLREQLLAYVNEGIGKRLKVMIYDKRNGKTYLKINDYAKLRELFGELLAEIQRIKSEGDYEAGAKLVEKYAVKVDPEIHKEVLERYAKLNIAPYKGFVNPIYTPVTDEKGNITDIKIDYTENYVDQMLRYSRDYSPLTK